MKVAIQGVRASFHDVAARKYFQEAIELVECSTFPKLFEALKNKDADLAVMAIENALAGSILPNYGLMEKYRFKILGEVYLRIEMCLMALPGEKLSDIRVVQSHPMALHQCQEFLLGLKDVRLIEHADTAESAWEIKTKNLRGHAAIASALAAETFGLELLQRGIENHKSNFTRFLILSREEDYRRPERMNKVSLRFETKHAPGSLAKVLKIFSEGELNLTKIQSVPIAGNPFYYGIHVDLEWKDRKLYEEAMKKLSETATLIMNFGEYASGEWSI